MPPRELPFLAELTALRRDIHAHPELAFNETARPTSWPAN
jgi:metal-dependent amidase/aminoacylase/carboxypeptidase family protein